LDEQRSVQFKITTTISNAIEEDNISSNIYFVGIIYLDYS